MKRFVYYIHNYPKVWRRWFIHFLWIFFPKSFANEYPPASVYEWIFDFVFYSIDVLGIPFWHENIFIVFKSGVRGLNPEEIEEAKAVFGNVLNYPLILIDDKSRLGIGNSAVAYVTFFMINYRNTISMPVFIHELVHIWQYQQYGSVYISKAIKAQKSKEGYDYGGAEHLYAAMMKGKSIKSFNFEQQAEILEDYYRKIKGKNISPMEKGVYSYYVGLIRETDETTV
ncbi:MAG: hypothetical protein IPN49_04135 [Saprospiraceae bacterium]|nr:hypothetical protein [Saprospiraceae bacterium]MBK8370910.1 hypothetical protein [Saprospiraceae bacterium]MBK8818304.1 hypothetical protein [Saprospiraceae bacterium]